MLSSMTTVRIGGKFSTSSNLGVVACMTASLVASVDYVIVELAESDGISPNGMMLYAAICTFIGAVLVDIYFWHVGYDDNQNWFVLFEIWTKKQREKFFEIPGFWKWFTASCLVTWLSFVLFIASFVYVANVADAVAIFDSHHIFVPLLGLCFKTGDQWKHRYFICLLIVVIGIFLIAQPHIISGYSIDNNSNQLIGVILSLCSAIFGAFVAVTFIMMKKLAYLDVMKQSIEQYIDILDDDDDNTSVDDKTPLLSQETGSIEEYFMNMRISGMEIIISEREMDFEQVGYLNSSTTRSMLDLMNKSSLRMDQLQIESNEYIIQNDWAIKNLFVEYYSIGIIIQCLIFSLFSQINGDVTTSHLWKQFAIENNSTSLTNNYNYVGHIIGASILWWFADYLFTYGAFKFDNVNVPVVAVLDVSNVFFTFVLCYVWLDQTPNYLEILGAALVVVTVVICVYPWQKIIQGSKHESALENF